MHNDQYQSHKRRARAEQAALCQKVAHPIQARGIVSLRRPSSAPSARQDVTRYRYAERHTKVVKYRTHRYGVSVPKYTAQLNRGYRPGESKVQQKDLLGWVRRQLGLSGSDMYRAAYLIARKIRDHGTRYRGFIDIKSIHHTVRLKRGIRRSFNRHWRRA